MTTSNIRDGVFKYYKPVKFEGWRLRGDEKVESINVLSKSSLKYFVLILNFDLKYYFAK